MDDVGDEAEGSIGESALARCLLHHESAKETIQAMLTPALTTHSPSRIT